jgi:hypothetical protein
MEEARQMAAEILGVDVRSLGPAQDAQESEPEAEAKPDGPEEREDVA